MTVGLTGNDVTAPNKEPSPPKTLVLMVLPTVAPNTLISTVCPTQIVDCVAERVIRGAAITITETVAVVEQVRLLLAVTVNVLTPTANPVATADAELVADKVTPVGPLIVYE